MSPRANKLRAALDQAESQLARAITDLSRAQKRVHDLTRRVPELQQAVNSLRVLLGDKPKSVVDKVQARMDGARYELMNAGVGDAISTYAKFAKPKPVEEVAADEDLLPDAEGTPLVEE